MKDICLTSAYLAPVEYFAFILKANAVFIEQYDNYIKQTYRNRCCIMTANGVMDLIIPVDKPSGEKVLTKDIRISQQTDWQTLHWRAIESAYNSTPFFEYYKDDFIVFYQKKWVFLADFNQAIQNKVFELIDVEPKIYHTSEYQDVLPENILDLREKIHPKKETVSNSFPEYYQVFAQKFGFTPNLSIIDLLFNMGNESILVLQK
ncbi:WbqC family protein [Paludibacteraceae bacterium OttesenSCG-928-F17]|nr:WbqC family protein [Paludibacteraceae bacterium OttesenSCG-928-F17]